MNNLQKQSVNVEEIMRQVKQASAKRALEDDLAYLGKLHLKDFDTSGKENFLIEGDFEHENKSFAQGMVYLRDNSRISGKLNFVKSHRKGIFGLFTNFVLGKIFLAVKTFFGKILLMQESFNRAAVNAISTLDKRTEREFNGILYPDLKLDYKKFEDRYRGDQSLIIARQREYLDFFKGCHNVLDIGCGRGEFMELLKDNNIGALGLEISDSMMEQCCQKGLNVEKIDAISYLGNHLTQKPAYEIDGIFCSQVIEHMYMNHVVEMLRLCYESMKKDSFIVLETINIKSLVTFTSSVYLDPTHVKPIHPGTLEFILESVGFRDVKLIYSSDVPDDEKLGLIKEENENDRVYNDNVSKLNNLLFGPQDYAAVAKK